MACKTPSNDSKMLLKVVFDKTVFVKFRISNNFKQKIDKTHQNNKKSMNQKSRDFCQMFVIYKKKTIPQAMDLKIYIKSKA